MVSYSYIHVVAFHFKIVCSSINVDQTRRKLYTVSQKKHAKFETV